MCEPIRVEVTHKRERGSKLSDLFIGMSVAVLAYMICVPPPQPRRYL